MSVEAHHSTIENAIRAFALAYDTLERLQAQETAKSAHERLLPQKGDQKTGLIGEYWAIRYARLVFPHVEFGGHSQKGWDFKVVGDPSGPTYIQLKTASEFGSGKLSPICRPSKRSQARVGEEERPDYWDELWLLWLDKSLEPVVLWKLKPTHVEFNGANCLKGKLLRRHPSQSGGSNCFKWSEAVAVTDIRKKLRN